MNVFLSSTALDLVAYREVADDTILRLSQQSVAMERFGPLPGTPVEECERLARESDVVVCVVAHRYGYVPEKGKGSITRREVEAAQKAGKDVLVWIVAGDHLWTEKKEQDLLTDPNVLADPARVAKVAEGVAGLIDFKAWLRTTFTPETFTTPDDLGRKIAVALANYVAGHTAQPLPQGKISIARLPTTGSELFGREAELQLLDEAWANPNTNIVSFVAWGGVGKTALVNHWLKRRMARDNYRGAERVYGWSFFSQGTRERAASADLFIDQALRWFGDADPTQGSPWDKGERLASAIRQERTLLVLDGLEPLQHPPGFQEGRLKDAPVQALLVELAAHQVGLCVISTREGIGDLVEFENATVVQHKLEYLSPQAGAQILRSLNVHGDDDDLEEASRELRGHAFSLTLLGSYLDEVLDRDIRRRREVENLFADTRYGDAAQKMIAAYEKWLSEGMELAILRLLGLFDRPADLASIIALRERPAIVGLTEPLQDFKTREWNQAVSKLRRIRLLAEVSPDQPGTLDAHPLVREYFKHQLKSGLPETWREANNRLYQHLKNVTTEFPATVEEMLPLYAAVAHGCAAGHHEEVLKDVYWRRIQQGPSAFGVKSLGLIGAELAALSCFFEVPWKQLIVRLSTNAKRFLSAEVGFDLRAMGRLQEAAPLIQSSLDAAIENKDWRNAATAANNLSELNQVEGKLMLALTIAERSIDYLNRLDEPSERIANKTTLADVLHQMGRMEEAHSAFVEAETISKQLFPNVPFLSSLYGFRYCDFLLSLGRVTEVKQRATFALEDAKQFGDLLSIGLDNLSLGRALVIEAQLTGDVDMVEASQFLQQAVDGLRKAGAMEFIVRGLVARAELHRKQGDFPLASSDLAQAHRIAIQSEMRLYLADYHLESARLHVAQANRDKTREHLEIAKAMIDSMGYHRRDKEVAELEDS